MLFDKSYWDKMFPTLAWPKVQEVPLKYKCLHDNCSDCKGTGVKSTGGMCIHAISCSCPKCRIC